MIDTEELTIERIAEMRLAYIKRLEKQVADLKAQVENLLEFGEYFMCRECELHSPIDDPCECCPHCGEHPGEPDLDRLCRECGSELNDAIAMRDEIAYGRL